MTKLKSWSIATRVPHALRSNDVPVGREHYAVSFPWFMVIGGSISMMSVRSATMHFNWVLDSEPEKKNGRYFGVKSLI